MMTAGSSPVDAGEARCRLAGQVRQARMLQADRRAAVVDRVAAVAECRHGVAGPWCDAADRAFHRARVGSEQVRVGVMLAFPPVVRGRVVRAGADAEVGSPLVDEAVDVRLAGRAERVLLVVGVAARLDPHPQVRVRRLEVRAGLRLRRRQEHVVQRRVLRLPPVEEVRHPAPAAGGDASFGGLAVDREIRARDDGARGGALGFARPRVHRGRYGQRHEHQSAQTQFRFHGCSCPR